MTGPLENSVTLEDVFAVVAAKRVPLAAELAGYLALEMAEGAGSAPGALEAANVYVSDEGTVALVRVRKDGDAEASIRTLLGRLLEAGGTQTPALGVAAKKAPSGGPTGSLALVRELEAALIPVNRAAGRRALARLAREVKRVTHGVGRNASIPPAERGSRASVPDARRASAPGFSDDEMPTTAKRNVDPDVLAEVRRSEPPPAVTKTEAAEPGAPLQRPISVDLPTVEISSSDAQKLRGLPGAVRDSSRPPGALGEPAPPAPERSATPPDADELHPVDEHETDSKRPRDEVDSLLSSFGVSGEREEKGHARELKALVGLEPTPPPLSTDSSLSDADEASVEALLSLSKEKSIPPPKATERRQPPLGPRAGPVAAQAPLPGAVAKGAPNAPNAPSALSGRQPRPSAPEGRDEAPASSGSAYAGDRSLPTAPSARRATPPRPKRSAAEVMLWLVVAILVGAGGYLLVMRMQRPQSTTLPPTPSAPVPPPSSAANKRACKASLTVQNAPEKAEILLRVGQAPVEIDHMPVGARLEFVATADGHAPKRAVVPAAGTWEKGPDGKPRYELAVQLDPSRAKGGVDPWPPVEVGSAAGGEGEPGVVRIVSSPKGAEVWILVGLGPEALIERLPCGADSQLLVAGGSSLRKRLVVREADFVEVAGSPGQKAARISAK